MLLLVMVLIRTALIDEWRSQVPEDAANHFVMNIAEDEVDGVQELVRERATEGEFLFPMINGRVVQVNDLSAKAWQETAGRNLTAPGSHLSDLSLGRYGYRRTMRLRQADGGRRTARSGSVSGARLCRGL